MLDERNLKAAGDQLRREIKDRGVSLQKPKDPGLSETDTDGWSVEIGKLAKPALTVELWLDRWLGPSKRYFCLCFYTSKRSSIEKLVSALPRRLKPKATFDDRHWTEKKGVLRLKKPLRENWFNEPLLETYDKTSGYFFNKYDRGIAPLKSGTTFDVSRGATFVEDVVLALRTVNELNNKAEDKSLPIEPDNAKRMAVEARAMVLAKAHLEKLGFEIKNSSKINPFDFYATKDGKSIYVEVKGTTALDCKKIMLTATEVARQRTESPDNALVVVSGIELSKGNPPIASGGNLKMFRPWTIELSRLKPTQYVYTL